MNGSQTQTTPDVVTQDDINDAIANPTGQPTSSGGTEIPLSTSTHNASAAQLPDDVVNSIVSGVRSANAQQPPPDSGGILDKSFKSIAGGVHQLWDDAKGILQGPDNPENIAASGAGFVRGIRDVSDKTMEYPNPDIGYTPSDADLDTVRQQNIADRAAAEKQYGDNPSFSGHRMLGQATVLAPVLAPLSGAVSTLLRGVPYLGDAIAARGLTGIGGRAVERAVTGGTIGGAQSGLTSDPTQPLLPQIIGGVEGGAGSGLTFGAGGDIISNAIKRLTGGVIPVNSYTGQVNPIVENKAANAQSLINQSIPIKASQISNDPVLSFMSKYGEKLPGSGAGDFSDYQAQQARNAVIQRASPGSTSSLAGPDFIKSADANTSQMYGDTVGSVPTVPETDANGVPIRSAFNQIRADIPTTLMDPEAGQIHRALDHIQGVFDDGDGEITGDAAHALTRRTNSTLSPLFNSDNPDVRISGAAIRNAVNDRLRPQMTPEQQAIFDAANDQFRATRTLENVADANGNFQPGPLFNETQKVTDRFGSPGTLDDLARAQASVLQPDIDAKAAPGPRASLATAAVAHPLVNLLTQGVGWGTLPIAAPINRGIQAMNRATGAGPRAVNNALTGGGSSVADLRNALNVLNYLSVGSQQGQPPSQ